MRELDPAAKAALGKMSPKLAKDEVLSQVAAALEDPKLARQAHLLMLKVDWAPELDGQNLLETLEAANPVTLVNQISYINPTLKMKRLTRMAPLEVLEAALRMVRLSDHWATPPEQKPSSNPRGSTSTTS